jgi:P27 family predicted phage terminase small subunit
MKQRGRKSIGDLSVVEFPDARVTPPTTLTAAQTEEWWAIVNSLPADFFRPADVPLLAQFCRHSAMANYAAQLLEADGAILRTEKGWPFPNPALQLLNSQSSAMATLASKLRLCPSARMVQVDASKQAGDGTRGARPWQGDRAKPA